MTDYEELIKEARTLEGMYYNGKKIVQSIASIDCIGGLSFMIQDDNDDAIYSSGDYDIDEVLRELERIKKQCYKPLTKVFIFSPDSNHIDECKAHRYACDFMLSLNNDIVVNIACTDEHVTPIEEIHEEIRRILNQKKQV